MVLPDLVILRWPFAAAAGRPAVTLTVVYEWDLAVTINPDQTISWAYHVYQPEFLIHGGGIMWLNGRLTKTRDGSGSREFYEILTRHHLSFGLIEAELRELTGYVAPIN